MRELLTNGVLMGIIAIAGLLLGVVGLLHNFTNDLKKRLYILLACIILFALSFIVNNFWSISDFRIFLFTASFFLILFIAYHFFYIRPRVNKGVIKPTYDNIKFKRFESIKSLTYGFIEYSPFFWKEIDNHKGIGIEVLKAVFKKSVTLERYKYKYGEDGSSWDNIFKDLEDKKFDIIVTPLFETRTRIYSHNIIYCSPIFYSSIGLYVCDDSLSGLGASKRDFVEAINFVRQNIVSRKWKPEILKGEIAEAIAKKYGLISNAQLPEFSQIKIAKDSDFSSILRNMSCGSNEFGDFTFMEVFKAESIIKNDPTIKVTNILKSNELLYPVSFVLRKEDTVLRNLINLRLLELRESGELKKIIGEVAKAVNIDDSSFEEIFIQKYDL